MRLVLPFVIALGALGCGPSPQPLPPPEEISVASARISIEGAIADVFRLVGGVGAVTGPADRIEVLNTGSVSGMPAVEGKPIADDGSFDIALPGVPTDALRLQAFGSEIRSKPLDLTSDGGGGVTAPIAVDCATATPPIELELTPVDVGTEAKGTVVVGNDCAAVALAFEAASVVDASSWTRSVDAALPTDLIQGQQVTVAVQFIPPSVGKSTTYLLLVLATSSALTETRPVTLHGTGR